MQHLTRLVSRLVLGAVLCAAAGGSVSAQTGTAPIQIDCVTKQPIDCFNIKDPKPADGKDTTAYVSFVHELALRGVTLTDSAAVRQLIFQHADEVWRKAGKEWVATFGNLKAKNPSKPTAEELDAYQQRLQAIGQRQRELFDKLLPELRTLVPADQRATFDNNLKVLQQSNYTVVLVNHGADSARAPTFPALYLVGCVRGACP